jgi:VCBS repeat-containing protein
VDLGPSAHGEIDSLSHRADTLTIPDAHLLFSGDLERSGTDLIVSDHLHRVVVPNYFHGDKRPTLVSPEGAPLDPKFIDALTGHVQYAQAAATVPGAKVVGHVVKMTGSASIVRNGVTIAVNNGDVVYQNDVVQTGSGSTLGLVMIDGTTFNLTANARLMMNDLTYDATSTSNTSLFTLVQGAATFVAGQVAKTGDMKVTTPVATLGIRGTAVILDISAIDGAVSVSVVNQRDGQVHAVQVYNTRGDLIGTVTSNGSTLTLRPTATFEVIAQESGKTLAQVLSEFNAFQQLLSTYDVGKQLVPNTPAPTDGRRGDNTQQPLTKFAGSTISPIDTTTTKFNAEIGGARDVKADVGTGDAPRSTIQTDPVTTKIAFKAAEDAPVQFVQVAATSIPFVVTPSPVSRISTGSGDHFGPVMSADGQFVTYDPDGAIYLFDRQTGATTTIASPSGGFTYGSPTISSDGHFVVYQGSDGTQSWIFIYNNDASDPAHYGQITKLMSGGQPAVSGDGSKIVVERGGSIALFDQQGHELANFTSAAVGISGTLWKPAISADGHVIAFWSSDSSSPGGAGQLFTYDLSTATLRSIASTATDAGSSAASFSADGHYVVYQSDTPGGHFEIYLYDLRTGQVVFRTANPDPSYSPVLSPDGHFIILASDARLTADDRNALTDIYVIDVTDPSHPAYKLVSVLGDGTQGNDASNLGAAISAGGQFVAFGSRASNFSSGDGPGTGDIFVVDPTSGHSAIILESRNSPAVLTASGVIKLTGERSGITLGVSDSRITASFDSHGDIQWSFKEPRSDFASLQPGQIAVLNFVITLSTDRSTTEIPVKVSIYDVDQPVVSVADAAPVASPVTLAAGTEDTGYTITSAALLAGVVDVDGPSLSISAVGILSGGGGIVDNHNGTFTYTPAPNYNGPVVFNYTASDGTLSASSTATLNVASVNDAPVVTKASFAVSEGGTVVLSAANIGAADLDSASFSFTVSNVPHGTFQTTSDGVHWTNAAAFTSADLSAGHVRFVHDGSEDAPTFSLQANDGAASNNLSSVVAGSVTFANVNDAPAITGAVLTIAEGGTVVLGALNTGVTDPDNNSFVFTTSNVSHGTFEITTNGSTWVPATTFTTADLNAGHVRFVHDGSDDAPTFSLQANDGTGSNALSSVVAGSVSFTQVNDAPLLNGASLTVSEGGTVVLSASNIGVTDPDSTSFTFTVSNVTRGKFETTTNGTNWASATTFTTADLTAGHVRFVHDGGEDAPAFSIQANDGAGSNSLSNVLAGSVTFTNVNDAPVATITPAQPADLSEDGTLASAVTVSKSDPDAGDATHYDMTGWTPTALTSFGGHFYRYVPSAGISWTSARAQASAMGGHLANISSAAENSFIQNSVKPAVAAWIGASDAAQEGTWTWADGAEAGQTFWLGNGGGSAVTYANWWGTEPNGGISENYGFIDHNGVWTDVPVTNFAPQGFIVEFVANYSLANAYGNAVFDTTTGELTFNLDNSRAAVQSLGAGEHRDVEVDIVVKDLSGAATIVTATFGITGTNDAPVIGAATLAAVDENTANPAGQTVSALFAGRFHDADAGSSLKGIAVVANHASAAEGVWQYMSVANGIWEDVGTVSESEALAFDLTTKLRFVPAHDFYGTPGSLDVRGLDETYDEEFTVGAGGGRYTINTTDSGTEPLGHGGTTPISDLAVTLGTSVTRIDDAPVVTAVSAGNHNHVLSSTDGYVPGRVIDQGLQLTNLGIAGDTDVTIEFWANFGDDVSQMPVGFDLYDLNFADFGGGIGRAIGFNTGNGDVRGVQRSDLIGQWHHYAAVFHNGDATQSQLYIDGQLQTLTQLAGGPFNPWAVITDNPRIGGWDFDSIYSIDGRVDDVRVYHGARAAVDIVADMNASVAGPEPNLVAAYTFETVSDGIGGVTDLSGNGHHATLTGLSAQANIVPENSADEGQALVFSAANRNTISVGDADDGSLSVTLSVSHGVITLASLTGLTIEGGANSTSTVTIHGLVADINAALEGLSYHPAAHYSGADALIVTATDGVLSDAKTVNLTVNPANFAPVANDDGIGARVDFLAISSSLTFNDSDPDNDTFAISGADHNGTPAAYDDGVYTIQGLYGTLYLYSSAHSGVNTGGFVNFSVNAGDYIFAIDQDTAGHPIGNSAIYDLQPGQKATDTFTYTITDSVGAVSQPATITVTFDPAYVDLDVRTSAGYDTTSLWSDLHIGSLIQIDPTHLTFENGGKTIIVDGKDLTWTGSPLGGDTVLTGGLIKGFHVSESSGQLLDVVRYNIVASSFDDEVKAATSAGLDTIFSKYAYDSTGGFGDDVLSGGNLADVIVTGGGADIVHAGGDNDIIRIQDNAAWTIDGGNGIDTIALSGAFDLGGAAAGYTATNIEIFDLNITDINSIRVEPEALFNANAGHVLRILGSDDDTVFLARVFPGHPDGQWSLAAGGIFYAGDSATPGVQFNKYDYADSAGVIATLYVQDDVMVQYANDAPSIAGDLSVVTVKGAGVALTTADLLAVDPDTAAEDLVFTIEHSVQGYIFNSYTTEQLESGDTFTQLDLANGYISFIADDNEYVGQGSFTVSLSDGNLDAPWSTTVGVTIVDAEFRVLTTGGYDFEQDAPVAAIGASQVDGPVTSTQFTLRNAAANRDFSMIGDGFVYNSVTDTFTAGTITFITIIRHDASAALATLALNVDAAEWMSAVHAAAAGDRSLIEALTGSWTFNFVGQSGADAFTAGSANDIFTGRAGDDILKGEFGYDRANYGSALGPVNIQLTDGNVTEYDSSNDVIGLDRLRSIELVTGSNFDDTFSAAPTSANPSGFNASGTNAGSTVTGNVSGQFNEFEGRGGHDDITGNGQTRISYLHATGGVVVTFDASSWDLNIHSAPGAAGTVLGDASVGQDNFVGVNSVRGSHFADFFYGSLNPSQTAENFEGMGGNDWIDGGGGFDRAIYFLASDGVGISVNLAAGTVFGGIHTGSDTLRSVEGIWGTDFTDIYDASGFSTTSTNAGSTQISVTNPNPSNFNEFEGGGGNDQVTGNGNTRVAFYHATGGVVVALGSGDAWGNGSVGHDTFASGVTRVRGSEFNDIITGDSSSNTLEGQGGNDVLDGKADDDTLTGGTGADTFVYNRLGVSGGVDTITDFSGHSGEGDRIDLRAQTALTTFAQLNTIAQQVGADTVITFNTNSATQLVLQGIAKTTLTASDFIFAGQVAVAVQTPDGYDFGALYDDLAASSMASSGNDANHIFAVNSAKGITFEFIGSGIYSAGAPTNGTITEIIVLNTVDVSQFVNIPDHPQPTQDHVLVNSNGWNINASTLFTAVQTYGSSGQTTGLDNIFNVPSYSIVGASGLITTDNLSHAAADVMFGGTGADKFNGLSGNDTVDYSHATAPVTVDLSTPGNNTGAAAGDIHISIENLRGSNFNDILTGDAGNNVLEGGLGDDRLDGVGSTGNTASYEHATPDAMSGLGVGVNLTIQGSATSQNTIRAGTDTLINIQNVRGSAGKDTLIGDGNDNVLEGGPGADSLNGGIGTDTASYEHAEGVTTGAGPAAIHLGITANLANASGNTGDAEGDSYSSIENLTGSQFSDILSGNAGPNTLFGLGGNDIFVFNSGSGGHDVVGDFLVGHDKIELNNFLGPDPSGNPNWFADWTASGAFTQQGNDTLIHLDVTDVTDQDTILLKNVMAASLHANDFLVHPGVFI